MKQPDKKLGYWDGAVLIFSNVVGVGIFTTPSIVATYVDNEGWFMLAWLIGGLFVFVGALAYAELSIRYPKAGGEYVYLKHAYGSLTGFLSGWTSFMAGFSGAIAASAMGFALYLNRLLIDNVSINEPAVAIALIILVSVIHILSVKAGSKFHYWLGGLALIAIIILIVMGLRSTPDSKALIENVDTAPLNISDFLLAMIPILFTYSGWNAAVYMAEEIKNPKRNMLKALLLGTTAVIAVYLLLNFIFIKNLSIEVIAKSVEIGYDIGWAILGEYGFWVITVIILLALLSSVSAMIMAGPRIYFAMSRDKLFPSVVSRVHSKFKTPYLAIMAQSLWSILLVLSGTFEDVLLYTGFSLILFSGLAVLSAVTNSEVKINLFKSVCFAVFSFICLAIVINGIYSAPKPSIFGCIIIALGIPVYFWFKKRN